LNHPDLLCVENNFVLEKLDVPNVGTIVSFLMAPKLFLVVLLCMWDSCPLTAIFTDKVFFYSISKVALQRQGNGGIFFSLLQHTLLIKLHLITGRHLFSFSFSMDFLGDHVVGFVLDFFGFVN